MTPHVQFKIIADIKTFRPNKTNIRVMTRGAGYDAPEIVSLQMIYHIA